MLLSTFSYTKIRNTVIFIVNYAYLCTWTISLSLYLSQLDVFLHGISEAAYAVLSMAESHDDKAIQSGHWVGKIVQT